MKWIWRVILGGGMAAATIGKAAAARRMCLLTDVEGNWQYVRNVARQSSCLRLVSRGLTPAAVSSDVYNDEDLEIADDCVLVFGGDAGDKGAETLKCYDQLVRLKKRHPERVVLLVGNRDANKMRFTSELDDSEMDLNTMTREIRDGPVWVPQAKRVTLLDYLRQQVDGDGTCKAEGEAGAESTESLAAVNTKVNRLKWMLEHTMGSQDDFERRRKELAMRSNETTTSAVDDEDVLRSFIDSVEEGGTIRDYLRLGSLAFISDRTLFVHGGIMNGDVVLLGKVPDEPDVQYESVSEWVDKLNGWYQREVQAWIDQPTWSSDQSTRGGNELLKYVLPDYPTSVVMGRHLLPSGMPALLPSSTIKTLAANGIDKVIVGHTPHGNCPTVINQGGKEVGSASVQVIMCDTSYSDAKADDNRGIAASDVVLEPDGTVQIRGVLENGRPISYTTSDSIIGRTTKDGMQVKAKMADADDEYLIYSVQNGFSYSYGYRAAHELGQ